MVEAYIFLQTEIKMVVLFDEFLQVCVFSLQPHVAVLIPSYQMYFYTVTPATRAAFA